MNKVLLLLIIVSFFGCNAFDKPELVPAYIEIDQFHLSTSSFEGTDDSEIHDCWVYVDSKFIGIWELPARIPIVYNGTHKVELYPGIYKSGVKDLRTVYPFYTYYSEDLDLKPNETIKVSPDITYQSGVVKWIEDFDDPSFKLADFGVGTDVVMTNPDTTQYADVFEGKRCGLIQLNSSQLYCEMRTDEPAFNTLPRTLNEDAYLEINYKCNYEFVVGLLDNNNGLTTLNKTAIITFNSTVDNSGVAKWKKTYVYLPDATNFYQNASIYDLYISVLNTSNSSGIEIAIDNLKVVF